MILLNMAIPAEAITLLNEQNTVTIPAGHYIYFPFQLERGDKLHYDFTVTNGTNINAFIVEKTDFVSFQNGKHFDYYGSEQAATGRKSDNITFSVPDDANYYLVFDNSNKTGNSTITYSIQTIINSEVITSDDLWFIVPFVFILVVAIIVYAKRRWVKTDNARAFSDTKGENTDLEYQGKQASLIKRWKYLRQLDKAFKEKWQSPPHKGLIYAFSILLVAGGALLLLSGIRKEMDIVSVFVLLNLLALPSYYEEIRLAIIDWREKNLISNTLLVPGGIIFIFLFAENIMNPYDTFFSFGLIIYLVFLYLLLFFRPLDLFLTKTGRKGAD